MEGMRVNMQIKINLKIFLFFIIFIITKQIKIYAIIMLFALIHELGHLAMGIVLGFKPESISIIPTGFSIKFKADSTNYNTEIKKRKYAGNKEGMYCHCRPINKCNHCNYSNNIL